MCLQRRLPRQQETPEQLPIPESQHQLPLPEPRGQHPMGLEAGRPWDFLHCVVCLHNCGKEATLGLNPAGASGFCGVPTFNRNHRAVQKGYNQATSPPPLALLAVSGFSQVEEQVQNQAAWWCMMVCKASKPSLKELTHQSALL